MKNNENLLAKGDKLLIYNNIELNNKYQIIKKIIKKKGSFKIPAIFQNYTKNNLLNITVSKNYLNILEENENYIIKNDLVSLVGDDGFNYYLESE